MDAEVGCMKSSDIDMKRALPARRRVVAESLPARFLGLATPALVSVLTTGLEGYSPSVDETIVLSGFVPT